MMADAEPSAPEADPRVELDARLEDRRRVGVFVAYLVAVVGLFIFALDGLRDVTSLEHGTTVVTVPIVLVMGALLASLMRALRLPGRAYGITRHRWRASLREGLLLGIGLSLGATIAKWWLVTSSAAHASLPIFDPLDTRGAGPPAEGMLARFVLLNVAYVVVVVPIQELIARGLLQGMLERILVGRHVTAWSVVLSSLLFAAFHVFISTRVAIATLVLGIAVGWLYARHRNLLGPCVAHALVGAWALTVVRLQPMLD